MEIEMVQNRPSNPTGTCEMRPPKLWRTWGTKCVGALPPPTFATVNFFRWARRVTSETLQLFITTQTRRGIFWGFRVRGNGDWVQKEQLQQ